MVAQGMAADSRTSLDCTGYCSLTPSAAGTCLPAPSGMDRRAGGSAVPDVPALGVCALTGLTRFDARHVLDLTRANAIGVHSPAHLSTTNMQHSTDRPSLCRTNIPEMRLASRPLNFEDLTPPLTPPPSPPNTHTHTHKRTARLPQLLPPAPYNESIPRGPRQPRHPFSLVA